MGWFSEAAIGHEGYAIGLLNVDGYEGGRLRELTRDDASHRELSHVGAACECGWRSQRLRVSEPVHWTDGWLQCSERLRDRIERLWTEHVALVEYRQTRADGFDDHLASLELRRNLESVDRCKCGHERRLHGTKCSGWDDFQTMDGKRVAPILGCPCRGFHFQPMPA
jgi:hypothetical protein